MPKTCLLGSMLFFVAIVWRNGAAGAEPHDSVRSRSDFAHAMDRLNEGTSEQHVLELLGRPDDVRTGRDLDGFTTVGTKEIWRYGTSGHLTPATLGQVYISREGRVQYMYGGGAPPPDGMFSERELRQLIGILAAVPSYNSGSRYNPLMVIRAVNRLQPLGKEKSLAAIQEFLRVSSRFDDEGREGMFLVLRTLFDVPAEPGFFPPMLVGAPSPSPPTDPKLLPRFPIALVGDIPFLLVDGYTLHGRDEPPEHAFDYFKKNGKLRPKLLVPTERPFRSLDEFIVSPQWIFAGSNDHHSDQRERDLLREQALRLLGTVYAVQPDRFGKFLPDDSNEKQRRRHDEILTRASEMKIRWDATLEKYTFLDGTSLPKREKAR